MLNGLWLGFFVIAGLAALVRWLVGGDPAVFAALCEARGAKSVPLPMPKHLPPWAQLHYAQGNVTNWTAKS